jgi:GNAT superfamily N-acetyltransferase
MKFLYNETPIQEDIKFLENKLLEFNRGKIENYVYTRFGYKYVNDFDSIIAGIDCQAGGGWLYIVSLWVEKSNRGKGLGNELLSAAEKKAVEKGCHDAYLYTYSFQSPGFYEKNGYAAFGKLDHFCGDHKKLFLKKRLA